MAQPQTRVSARRGGAVFCRHATKPSCVPYAPYGPVLLPADRCPRAARERFARPRIRNAPFGERDSSHFISKYGTIVNILVTACNLSRIISGGIEFRHRLTPFKLRE